MYENFNIEALVAALKTRVRNEADLSITENQLDYVRHYSAACVLSHLIEDIEAGKFSTVGE